MWAGTHRTDIRSRGGGLLIFLRLWQFSEWLEKSVSAAFCFQLPRPATLQARVASSGDPVTWENPVPNKWHALPHFLPTQQPALCPSDGTASLRPADEPPSGGPRLAAVCSHPPPGPVCLLMPSSADEILTFPGSRRTAPGLSSQRYALTPTLQTPFWNGSLPWCSVLLWGITCLIACPSPPPPPPLFNIHCAATFSIPSSPCPRPRTPSNPWVPQLSGRSRCAYLGNKGAFQAMLRQCTVLVHEVRCNVNSSCRRARSCVASCPNQPPGTPVASANPHHS